MVEGSKSTTAPESTRKVHFVRSPATQTKFFREYSRLCERSDRWWDLRTLSGFSTEVPVAVLEWRCSPSAAALLELLVRCDEERRTSS